MSEYAIQGQRQRVNDSTQQQQAALPQPPYTGKQGPTAEDILRERIRETSLKYEALYQADMQLRLMLAAVEGDLAVWQARAKSAETELAVRIPPKTPPAPENYPPAEPKKETAGDVLDRAIKAGGAGNRQRIGLIT